MMSADFDLLPDTRRALLHTVATAQAQQRAPSVVATVIRDGRPVWTGGYGCVDGQPAGDDHQYALGSITKTFVAVVVLRLVTEGRLALTDPLDAHLPGTTAGPATIGRLLAHTAGLTAEPPGPWWERTRADVRPELADVLQDPPHAFPDGGVFHYSNPGYALLAAVIERLRDRPWHEAVRHEVLEPLGMTRTTLDPVAPHARGWAVHPWADVLLPEPQADLGRLAGAGQLWSTAADLARFAAFLLDGDERVLPGAVLAGMRTPASPTETTGTPAGYGLGLQLLHRDGHSLAGHTGSLPGFVAAVWVSPADGLGAVALANATAGVRIGTLAADLITTVADREPRIPPPWRPLPAADPELLALTGPWYWGPTPFALRLRAGGHLELAALTRSAEPTRLRPAGVDQWRGENGYHAGELLRIGRDTTGSVTHLDLGTFVFTRTPYDPDAPVPGGVDPAGWRAAG